MKKIIKKLLIGSEAKNQVIKFGIAKGIKMQIDVNSKAQRVFGLDEREIQKVFKEFSGKSNYFFDIGSSDGYYSLIYKKLAPQGKIFAFEVKEDLTREMEDNFKTNSFNYADVTLTKKFVSDKNDASNTTIDSIFNLKDQSLLFKIDVDGGEADVLNGIKNTLLNNTCFFIIETHTAELEKDCLAFLEKAGYKTTIIDNAFWRSIIPENRPIEHNRWFSAYKK
jgi:hypothetical protein